MLKYQSAILSIHLIPLRAQSTSAGTGCVCYDHKPKVAAFQNPPSTMTLNDVSFGTLRYISAAMLFLLLLKTNLSKTPVSGPYLAEEHYERASVNELDTPATTNRTSAPELSLHLIGERHSGTKWMSEYLQICFPSVDFSNNPFRWKHWFQDETLPDKHGGTRLVVVAQFRHPYAWTESSKLAFQPPSQHHIPLSSILTLSFPNLLRSANPSVSLSRTFSPPMERVRQPSLGTGSPGKGSEVRQRDKSRRGYTRHMVYIRSVSPLSSYSMHGESLDSHVSRGVDKSSVRAEE
jgi:hypothetical protein